MRTLIWWSVWGLVVGIGLFGLRESQRQSLHLLLAVPLLTGAVAAAVLRLKHEYHEALQHARWIFFSSLFLFLGTGYIYLKSEAYGPFATGTSHKAFLGTTFGMSVPEVERTLQRKLVRGPSGLPEKSSPESIKDWVIDMVPRPSEESDLRLLPELVAYHVPAQARFQFIRGMLGRVEVQFQKTERDETKLLVQRLREDLIKSYTVEADAPDAALPVLVFRKDDVVATIQPNPAGSDVLQVGVVLQYLPLAEKRSDPLSVNAQLF
jgi:hypothetical protein